jgi:hypothetical protein
MSTDAAATDARRSLSLVLARERASCNTAATGALLHSSLSLVLARERASCNTAATGALLRSSLSLVLARERASCNTAATGALLRSSLSLVLARVSSSKCMLPCHDATELCCSCVARSPLPCDACFHGCVLNKTFRGSSPTQAATN